MKILASILSVYILLLTAIACVDAPHSSKKSQVEFATHESSSNHNDTDNCTPLCTCDCCISNVIPIDNSIHLDCKDYTFAEYSAYSFSYISILFATIWQPPKIS